MMCKCDLKSDIRVAKLARGDYKHKVGEIDLTEDDIVRFFIRFNLA